MGESATLSAEFVKDCVGFLPRLKSWVSGLNLYDPTPQQSALKSVESLLFARFSDPVR